jgi:hypothetical protein
MERRGVEEPPAVLLNVLARAAALAPETRALVDAVQEGRHVDGTWHRELLHWLGGSGR